MPVLVTCMIEEDPIRNEGARVFTIFSRLEVYGYFSRRSWVTYSAVQGPNLELIQEFMIVLVTCKNEENPIKEEGARVIKTL